jgi:hypothetical protein
VHAVALCASCFPLYCPGASRPRQACSRLTSRFRVASYCRRVDLECDKHGIGGGSKHCDDSRLVQRPRQACSRLTSRFRVVNYCRRVDLDCDKHGIGGGSKHCDDSRLVRIMFPTIMSRRFAPAASVQSSYLTLSGCQLLSQGRPRVRQARHRRRQQTLRRQSSCAHHVPHYTVQALRARGKRAVV